MKPRRADAQMQQMVKMRHFLCLACCPKPLKK